MNDYDASYAHYQLCKQTIHTVNAETSADHSAWIGFCSDAGYAEGLLFIIPKINLPFHYSEIES